MSMKIFRLSSFLFAIAFAAAGFCFEARSFAGSAIGQNANSSTTMTENSNAGTTTRRRRGRRQTPPAPPAADAAAVPATEPSAAVAPVDTTVQADLSGTYAGTFDCADAGLTGDTTLTITGNQFTTSDGKSGRITAATTRGYTAVAMQLGELTPAASGQPSVAPTIVSLRAKKSRDRLTLTSVEGATHVCSFRPAGSRVAKQRRMPPPAPAAAEAAKPAPVAEPVAAPAMPAEPTAAPVTPAEPAKPAPVAEPIAAPATPAKPAKPAPVAGPTAAPVTPAEPGAEAGPMPPAAPKPARRGRTAKPKPAPATPPS
jgi:hypothetical protein